MLGEEELGRDLGPDPGPHLVRDRRIRRQSGGLVVPGEATGDGDLER
jgi:hypothetical protein